jgi:hypothetical protein
MGAAGWKIWVRSLVLCLMQSADIPLSLDLLSKASQPPPLPAILESADGGSVDEVFANVKVSCAFDRMEIFTVMNTMMRHLRF